MTITEKTVYVTMGKQFDSEEKAKQHRFDLIGEFFDKLPCTLHPSERIKLVEFIVANRGRITMLLDY